MALFNAGLMLRGGLMSCRPLRPSGVGPSVGMLFRRDINHPLLQPITCTPSPGYRHLFSFEELKMPNYLLARASAERRISSDFQLRMKKLLTDPYTPVFKTDLEIMCVVARREDIDLMVDMITRFCEQDSIPEIYIGTDVMRTLYYWNLPNEAFKLLKSSDLGGFFSQYSAFKIAMDLLFNNKMYAEVLELHEMLMLRKTCSTGEMYPPVFVLLIASWTKINTPESFNECKSFINEISKRNLALDRRCKTLVAYLAFKQNHFDFCLDLLASFQPNYQAARNLKIICYLKVGNLEESVRCLRPYVSSTTDFIRICKEIADELKLAVEKRGNDELKGKLKYCLDMLEFENCILDETLENILPMNAVESRFTKSKRITDQRKPMNAVESRFTRSKRITDQRKPTKFRSNGY